MENNKRHFIVRKSTLLYGSWLFFIAFLTLIPGKVVPDFDWDFLKLDKWIHFGVFAVLSCLGIISFKQKSEKLANNAVVISLVIALFYGTLLEFGQSLVPERTFDYADLVANYAGSLFGYVLFRGVYNILYR